jgi:hypothetical protein
MVSVRNICEVRKKRGSDGRRTQAFDRSAQEENAWPAAHAKELRRDGTEKCAARH